MTANDGWRVFCLKMHGASMVTYLPDFISEIFRVENVSSGR